jgi:hypothetical protein
MSEMNLPPLPPTVDPAAVQLAGMLDALMTAANELQADGIERLQALLHAGSFIDAECGRTEMTTAWYRSVSTSFTADTPMTVAAVRSTLKSSFNARQQRQRIVETCRRLVDTVAARTPKMAHVDAALEHVRHQLAQLDRLSEELSEAFDDYVDLMVLIEGRAMVREGEVEDGTVPHDEVMRDLDA